MGLKSIIPRLLRSPIDADVRHLKLPVHLDEAFVKIDGDMHYLWRAVDHEGEILESYITKIPDRKAALKFLKKSMKRYGASRRWS